MVASIVEGSVPQDGVMVYRLACVNEEGFIDRFYQFAEIGKKVFRSGVGEGRKKPPLELADLLVGNTQGGGKLRNYFVFMD